MVEVFIFWIFLKHWISIIIFLWKVIKQVLQMVSKHNAPEKNKKKKEKGKNKLSCIATTNGPQ